MTLAAVGAAGAGVRQEAGPWFNAGWTDFLPRPANARGRTRPAVRRASLPATKTQWHGKTFSTLAHEAGHSMPHLLAGRASPSPPRATHLRSEIASTPERDLLCIGRLPRPATTTSGSPVAALESLRTTLFRQTMFAIRAGYPRALRKGRGPDGEALSTVSGAGPSLLRADKGICSVPDLYGDEWSFVPQFFYDFYVYSMPPAFIASRLTRHPRR